jgi:hypothetical protein
VSEGQPSADVEEAMMQPPNYVWQALAVLIVLVAMSVLLDIIQKLG